MQSAPALRESEPAAERPWKPLQPWMVPALVALVVLLLAEYALPLFVPPAALPVAPLAPDATLLERLFPGVPPWWVGGRLLCLGAALALLVWIGPTMPTLHASLSQRAGIADRASTTRLRAALGSAALQALAGIWASDFNRPLQLIYLAWFAVPPLLVVSWRRRSAPGIRRWRTWLVVGGIVGVWLFLRVPAAWRSPQAADLVDTWIGTRFLTQAADPAFNLLTGRFMPGSGSLHFVLQGAGLLHGLGIQPSFGLAQATQVLWLAVAGIGVGLLTTRLAGLGAGAVATVAFLFSPFTLMMLLTSLPMFFYPLVTIGLLILLVKVHDDASLPALVALGALAGIGATLHSANIVSVVVMSAAVWSAWRSPRLPKQGVIIAILLFIAAVLTGLSDIEQIQSMARTYTHGRAQWVAHEMAGFGQISPQLSEYAVEAAIGGRPIDTPLSALLAPFAVPRIPLRVLGDALFDPIGTCLSAVGIAVCLRALWGSWLARVLLGVLVAGLLPGCVSSQDRIAVIRLIVTPVPMALLAGIGWETVRRWVVPGMRPVIASGIATVALAVGGMLVFDVVNPRILASSWVSLSLRALASVIGPTWDL